MRPRALWLLLAGVCIAVAFIVLNLGAYDGFFQDDELDTLKWAPSLPAREFLAALLNPRFAIDNFRPVGHSFYRFFGRPAGLNYPRYIAFIHLVHLINVLLAWLVLRALGFDTVRAEFGVLQGQSF